MNPLVKIDIIRFFARRLNELPAPELSPSELDAVLRWEFFPASASDIYNYALRVRMFQKLLVEVDPNDLDNETKKLITSTMKKVGLRSTGDGRYSELFASLAGILMANLLYYYSSNSWAFMLAYWIPPVVTAVFTSQIMDAKDRNGLSRTSSQQQEFFQSYLWSLEGIFIIEYGVPGIEFLWGLSKRFPWWSCGAVVIVPFIYPILVDRQVKAWWLDIRLRLCFYYMALSGWIEIGGQQGARRIFHRLRQLAKATNINLVLKGLARLAFQQPDYRKRKGFTYPQDFQHRNKIRLLQIDRKIPLIDLEARLIEVDDDLLQTRHYDAISHVWGHGEKSQKIILNGHPFPVTSSVYNILYRCSSYFGQRLVWIDTVCINQACTEEKEFQIRKMRSIYDHARRVQIFFVDSPRAWLAVPFMHHLLKLYGSPKDHFTGTMTGILLRKNMDKWLRVQIDALLELLVNPWFERAWVVQEFVVAREVTVNYGRYSFDWEKLTLLAEMLEDEEAPEAAQCLTSGGDRSGTELRTWIRRPVLLDRWKTRLLFERQVQLSQVLSSFQGCKASRLQDKIFAFIGFTDSAEEMSDMINYTLPTDTILLTLTHHFLRRGELLETFPFAGLSALPTYSTNLPTWVADWTVTRRVDPIASAEHLRYNASGVKDACVKQGNSEREIVVAGVIFDKIWKISEIDLDYTPDAGTIRSNPRLISKALDYFNSAIGLAREVVPDPYNPIESMNQPLEEAISRTMIGDATKKSRPAAEEYQDIVSRFVDHGQFIRDAFERGHFQLEDIHPLPWGPGAYEDEPWREQEVRKLMQHIENVRWLCGGEDTARRFCVTEKGFIGMVPRKTTSGDLVCLLYGSPVPMILRKDSSADSYRLVGEAYIHGIMDGEGQSCDIFSQDLSIN